MWTFQLGMPTKRLLRTWAPSAPCVVDRCRPGGWRRSGRQGHRRRGPLTRNQSACCLESSGHPRRVSLIVLDTDVASTILLGRQADRLQAKLAGHNWLISFVTLGELTHWTIARSWGPRKLADLARWRQDVVVLPADEIVSETWGAVRARAAARGRPRPANDTRIAACCLVHQLPLATFNTKDFVDFAQYEGLVLLDLA